MANRVQSWRENKNMKARVQAKFKDQMSPVWNNQYQCHHLKSLSWTKSKISVTHYLIRSNLMSKANLYHKKIKAIDKNNRTLRAKVQITPRITGCIMIKYQTRRKRKLRRDSRNRIKLRMMTRKKPEDY